MIHNMNVKVSKLSVVLTALFWFLGYCCYAAALPNGVAALYYGKVCCDGRGVGGVAVTDGRTVVLTDESGRYSIESDGYADFVYISVPTGYAVSERNYAPEFYRSVRPHGKQKVDFELTSTGQDETRHLFVLWADVQVYEPGELKYVEQAAHDVETLVEETGLPAIALSCGDIIGEMSNEDVSFQSVAEATAKGGIPFHYAIGNHDLDLSPRSNDCSRHTYKSTFGPTYYSFNKGKVHYVVMDNVFSLSNGYVGYLEERQLSWLENDLSYVPEGSTVIVCMHIPTYSREARAGKWKSEEKSKITSNRQALYNILKPYNAHICSAHEHYSENYVLGERLFEHVHPPLSGLFWQSFLSMDGIPWGYTVYEFDGDNVSWRYKAVGMSVSEQFSAYPVGADPKKLESVVANVWNYDPAWKVMWYENGELQGEMEQYSGYDRAICKDVEERREKEFKWDYIGAGKTEHLFYATPSSPESEIVVEVTDRFGNVYSKTLEGRNPELVTVKYTDAAAFPVYGKCVSDEDSPRYERLPQNMKDKVRDAVWFLSRNSAGLYVRFRSNSTSISARWTSTFDINMNHMTPTGIKGLDLYVYENGRWRFAGTGRPTGKTTEAVIVSGMSAEEREYMLYLSLYDGVEALEIGVDADAMLDLPLLDSPRDDSPIVAYGTSILQGGCASRPGMAHTNILSRILDRTVINLGFSGNALLDYEIAEVMAEVETPSLYILDYVPNASAQQIRTKGETFFRILRDKHPAVPVIFIEDPTFPHSKFNADIRKEVLDKNKEQKALFERLKQAGERKIYYITTEGMLGDDGEATVDGIHFTDLGMMRYVEHILPTVMKALE